MMDGAPRTIPPTSTCLGIDRERLERENSVRLNFSHVETREDTFLPFAHGGFETPSGKAELYKRIPQEAGTRIP